MIASLTSFFLNVYMNPAQHENAIWVMAGVIVAACAGLAYLVMQVYEKYCPERT